MFRTLGRYVYQNPTIRKHDWDRVIQCFQYARDVKSGGEALGSMETGEGTVFINTGPRANLFFRF